MTKSKTILCVVIALLLYSAIPGNAQIMRQRMMQYNDLMLTSEQMAKIQELRFKFQEEIFPVQAKLQTHYLELNTMASQGADRAKIDAKIDEISKIKATIQKKSMEYQKKIRNLLTDEQKVYFDQQGFGLGMGLGPGWGQDMGRGRGMGYGMGYGRGFGAGRGFGRGWGRGRGMGFGFPWYRLGRGRYCPLLYW